MFVGSPNPQKMEKIRDDIELPIIDLHHSNRSQATSQMVKACEEYGFFKVINHGVPQGIISRMEQEAHEFFSKPGPEKQRAGPANPYGYGCKNIGLNGDMGEVEYLLLQTNSPSISHPNPKYLSNDPNCNFRCAVSCYVAAVRELACEILDMMGEGLLGGPHPSSWARTLSGLISDPESDCLLRLNHYPPSPSPKLGFGEHTDPQILTLLRSNAVGGLQISTEDGVWVPVTPYPRSAFCVNVGDVLQVMTNGRFKSVRHRAMVKSLNEARMSMAYFAGPPLNAPIVSLPGLATPQKPPVYRAFTWAEYKKATYARRLGDARLNLFKLMPNDDAPNVD